MRVLELSSPMLPAWDRYVLNHPQGLAYQLSGYTAAVKEAYGFQPRYLAAFQENRICGILALTTLIVPGLSGQMISSPYCDAGGILADSPEIEALLLGHGLAAARKTGASKLMLRSAVPFAGINPNLTCYPGKVRMVLGLKPCPGELLASFKSKVRSQVKKPVKEGLTFVLGGRELLHRFYGVYAENMRDLGSPPHAMAWFQAVLSAYANRAHIGIVSLPDGTPAAAGLILCHPNMVSIPWASSVRRYNRMNPNMLLYWRFLEFAVQSGAGFFDFGRSTPGEGTFKFKAQWGATPVPLHWAVFDGRHSFVPRPLVLPGQGPWGALRTQVEKGIGFLPVSSAVLLGTLARKYISL